MLLWTSHCSSGRRVCQWARISLRYTVGFELILTCLHLGAQILKFIAQIFARVREHLAFLFLDVVFDVFFQHFDFGRVGFVVGLNLGDSCSEEVNDDQGGLPAPRSRRANI
jgi:hypothetical protein